MPQSSDWLRGVHPRKAFPPPPARPAIALGKDLARIEDDALARALFSICIRARYAADAEPGTLSRWTRGPDVRSAASSAPELAKIILSLVECLAPTETTDRVAAARACHRLAQWASEQACGELAIQLSEAAMALLPTNPRALFEAARMNRMFGDLGAAEVLYHRAITYSRSRRHWRLYVRSHLGMGHVCKARGRRDEAAAHFATAAGAAWKRSGEKWLAGMTHHDLLVHHAEGEDFESAFVHALRAAEVMPVHNRRLPILVHDFCVLLVRMHAYRFALPLLESVVQKPIKPPERVIVWSTLGRAAAGAGSLERYRLSTEKVAELGTEYDVRAPAAHANLAFAAYALGLPEETELHAEAGIQLATARGETSIRTDIEALRDAELKGMPGPVKEPIAEIPPKMARFCQHLAARLDGWRGPTWKRKIQSGPEDLGRI